MAAKHCIASFVDMESMKCIIHTPTVYAKRSFHFATQRRNNQFCSLSMNGCQGDPRAPMGTIETRTFPAVPNPTLAMDHLNSAIFDMKSNPPPFDSGIIRVEVPIQQRIEALDWLRAQSHQLLPRCFFSGRNPSNVACIENGSTSTEHQHKLVSVAGIGSAVFFRHLHPFSLDDWRAIKRFLSKKCPLIRAYGAIRFDPRANMASEWEAFGSFYFMIPQVEFDEFEGGSMIAATVAWDSALSWTYREAVSSVEATIWQVSSAVKKLTKDTHQAIVLSQTHIPNKISWDSAVRRALDMINRKNSVLIKVVLARSSRVLTTMDIDPLMWLSCLQIEGDNSYAFCLQPPESPAFIGNTPERLFYRDRLNISSDALAGTRARGGSESLDIQIGNDLLYSPKDHHEFTVVREYIRRKLETVCSGILIEPEKALRKLPRVQHLYAQLTGTLEKEDDEFKILSSLHPTPAVCGFPAKEAQVLIAETEMFDRGLYAGPVGWFGGGESEFAVGIRSALVGKGIGALIYAGTGIVEGSNSALEWQELELKTSQWQIAKDKTQFQMLIKKIGQLQIYF
ncbi:isochorismate synthase, chloroplastic-like [Olea europaea subsp. europaea]|uniref:isochorismate synthase n=1 Tax=Olea europaea subsp. europaea TaxID=158383 RepID=A0A8S0TDT0_OLEEU|nr:isochorismate synthase, chloroplastic-like [Olea europaea subsp. europaea]